LYYLKKTHLNKNLIRSVFKFNFKQLSKSDLKIYNAVKLITGFYPKAVIAEFLFNTFPFKDEGFLSQLRSRIVSRTQLNKLSVKLGLHELIEYDLKGLPYGSIYGDAFEAFIGAIYLDQGFEKTKKFIVERLMKFHIDINDIENTDTDYKSKLINFCQRRKKQINFNLINEIGKGIKKEFIIQVEINQKKYGLSRNYSKRKAEQHAAEITIKQLSESGIIVE